MSFKVSMSSSYFTMVALRDFNSSIAALSFGVRCAKASAYNLAFIFSSLVVGSGSGFFTLSG